MSLALAIKRSYRFIVPPLAHAVRQTVRDYYLPAFCYLLGFSSALVRFVPWPQREGAMEGMGIALLILLLVGIWAKIWRPATRPEV